MKFTIEELQKELEDFLKDFDDMAQEEHYITDKELYEIGSSNFINFLKEKYEKHTRITNRKSK